MVRRDGMEHDKQAQKTGGLMALNAIRSMNRSARAYNRTQLQKKQNMTRGLTRSMRKYRRR